LSSGSGIEKEGSKRREGKKKEHPARTVKEAEEGPYYGITSGKRFASKKRLEDSLHHIQGGQLRNGKKGGVG